MSEGTDQHEINESYCFKWNDYENHLSDVVKQLLHENCMVDVTLAVAGERILAHRIVLCACSTLFREVLSNTTEDHPTIIITDISPQDMRSIIEFAYNGEVKIPVENINSLLDAARSLKICGLLEIEDVDETALTLDSKDYTDSGDEPMTVINETEENIMGEMKGEMDDLEDTKYDGQCENSFNKRRKRRRDSGKRDYSDDMLASAIADLRAGQTLIEAATKHNIPRSTLYMRAKALGIHLHAARNEYPPECMKAAIEAVVGGSSLQSASEMFRIPKTVLWRRIQKEGYQILRSEMRRSYPSDKREAAVKALERGENLTKVALEFKVTDHFAYCLCAIDQHLYIPLFSKIPKTTLFRDKARLVDEGKLPLSFWKKRKTENEELKKSRLEEAVAACKGGKMSQAAASMAFHIPKTTIWRRLQQDGIKTERVSGSKKQQRACETKPSKEEKSQGDADFTYCEVSSEIPITYIDENSIPEDSVIILTAEDMDELNLEEGRQIIINSESVQEYVPCAISIEETENYSQAES